MSWSKQVGDPVAVDEPICRLAVGDLEFEVCSTADGELSRINAEQGARVLEATTLAQVVVPAAEPAPEPLESTTDDLESLPDPLDSDEPDAPPKPKIETIEAAPIDPEFAPIDPVVEPPPIEIPSQPLEEARGAAADDAPAGEPNPVSAEPEPSPEPPAPAPEAPAPPPETEAYRRQPPAPVVETEPQPIQPVQPEAPGVPDAGTMPTGDDVDWSGWISPVVQMLAEEHGVELAEVRGTGVGGRIRKRDVLKHTDPRQHGA